VAFDGTNALVVWQDFRSGTSFDIYAARMDSTGLVLDAAGIPLSIAAFDQNSPAVAWDGSNYAVAWRDFRSGSNSDIFLARLSSTGVVLPKDVSGIAVTSTPVNSSNPALVAGASLQAAVTYNRLVEGTLLGSQRALLHFEYECPFDGGGARGPCLLTPAHATASGAGAPPPTFTWAKGGTSVARVEFSASPIFAKPRVWSGSFKSMTTFAPTTAQWSAITALAAPGSPLYWRVLGKTSSASTKVYLSADSYMFTVGP